VLSQKYLASDQIKDWVRNPSKSHKGGSIIWKAMVLAFMVVEDCLVWKVGDGRKLRIGEILGLGVRINICYLII